MPSLETTLSHLAPTRKKKLSQLAKRRHTSLASEVRKAIECYLAIGAEGINPDEFGRGGQSGPRGGRGYDRSR